MTDMSEQRYEISGFIGPCSESDAEAVADAILDLPEWIHVGGGGVGVLLVADDPSRVANSQPEAR